MTADFQSMCTYWKQFDLPELQKSLDNTANELALKQEKCEFARKRLVELSREFKKTTPEDTRKQVAPLLKSFQQEIDSFSKRAKFAESSFLNLYKKLIEVPDPVPLIENCLALRERSQKNNDKEEENKQLRETLAEYHIEFADIKNQEITIKHLKEKLLHHDEKFESSIAIRCKERERQLERTYEDKENQQKDRELSLIKQLGDTERRLSSLTAVMEKTQTELFELKSQFDQNLQAKVDEMDIVLNDMDIATERAASMERENERLKTQLHKSMPSSDDNASSPGSPGNTATELDIEKQLHAELANKEKELTHLVDELQRLHSLVAKQQEQHASIIRKLERELCKSELDNDSLRKTIDEFSDYDEIKRELSVLKSLEFNNDSPSDTNDKEEDKQTKTLETLLMTKNRTLQTDNTRLKLTNGQLTSTPARTPDSVVDDLSFANLIGRELASQYSSSSSSQMPACIDTADSPDSASNSAPPSATGTTPLSLTKPQIMSPLISSLAQLDTAFIATRVRELLAANNIGQRVFAKYVLGLSQGTVSELLSKPKHWDKLTEKGRDSYRKMASWAAQDSNITALRAYSPRKGQHITTIPKNKDSSGTDERINKILSDAQAAMNNSIVKKESIFTNDSSQIKDNSQSFERARKSTPNDCQHLNNEIVSRIYLEELTKLSQDTENTKLMIDRYKQDLHPSLITPHSSDSSPCTYDYSTTPTFTTPTATLTTTTPPYACTNFNTCEEPQDLSMKPVPAPPTSTSLNNSNGGSANTHEEPRHAASAFTALLPNPRRPLSTSTEASTAGDDTALSPLERMQTIANSTPLTAATCTTTSRNTTTVGGGGGGPLALTPRAILPSLRPEHFERCNDIDTEILVTRIKDALSQYSISQRLFGESVLGLSQGSVSDLLARPKAWSMLTMKGREPFVRMQLFVDDADAVVSLIAKQYRNHSTGGVSNSNTSASNGLLNQIDAKDNNNESTIAMMRRIDQATMASVAVQSVVATVKNNLSALAVVSPTSIGGGSTRIKEECHTSIGSASPLYLSEVSRVDTPLSSHPVTPITTPPRCQSPAVDTLLITSNVKELLQYHNLGQKLFGEVVLGLSQGSVSELLSKPKPWRVLSIKGREPFVKMQTWLQNVDVNIEALRMSQTERKMKRYRPMATTVPILKNDYNSIDDSSLAKKARVFFTRSQKDALHDAYSEEPYPNQTRIDVLANTLKVHPKTVVNWFHNHRMRAKQQQHRSPSTTPSSVTPSSASATLIASNPPLTRLLSTSPTSTAATLDGATVDGASSNHSSASGDSNRVSLGWMFPRFEAVTPKEEMLDSPPPPPLISMPFGDNVTGGGGGTEDRVNRRKKARPQRAYETDILDIDEPEDRLCITEEPHTLLSTS